MARKWFKFHFVVESFLNKTQLILHSFTFMNRWYYRFFILFFLVVFITVGIHPVLSQIPTVKPIKQELTDVTKERQNKNSCYIPGGINEVNNANKLMLYGKMCYELGDFPNAKELLEKAKKIFKNQEDQKINLAITYANLSLVNQQLSDLQSADSNIKETFNILNKQRNIDEKRKQPVSAQALNIQGKLQFAQGKLEDALISWEKAAAIYNSINNKYGKFSSQINQVQALQALGLFEPAKTKVKEIEKEIEAIRDHPKYRNLKSKVWRSLGDVLRAVGYLAESKDILKKSVDVAKTNEDKNAALLSLGNTLLAQANLARDREATANYEYMPWRCDKKDIPEKFQGKYQEAIEEYHNVGTSQGQSITEIKAKLNRLRLLIDLGNLENAQDVEKEINDNKLVNLVDELPNSRGKVYARINFAKSLACLQQKKPDSQIKYEEIIGQLTTAIKDAKDLSIEKDAKKDENLKDNRAISYATGNLGGLYEYFAWVSQEKQQNTQGKEAEYWQQQAENWGNKAQRLTEDALYLAQPAQMPDIAYQWQWQLGQLFEAKAEREKAIKEYENAVKTLESVRSDLLGINSDVQFNFRDNVEPVYRQLVALLLPNNQTTSSINIKKAIKNIDYLQLAELQNFLRCQLNFKPIELKEVVYKQDTTTAVLYPIVLKDSLEVILQLPNNSEPIRYQTPVQPIELEKTLKELRKQITNKYSSPDDYLPLSLQIYKWLMADADKYINPNKIKSLVFILDSSLRNIPLSALWDGKQFLIDKYAIAMTPGFEILTPKPLDKKHLKALIVGLTTKGDVSIEGQPFYFDPLPNVGNEAEKIKNILSGSTNLLNEQFNVKNLSNQLNSSSYPIIHIATHGNFSSNPEETFILTSENQYINMNTLQSVLKTGKETKPDAIDLIVFSACKTATSDRRATLGMAGVAVKAGAGSTIATLWSIADDSTACLMEQFYQNLQKGMEKRGITKAEALRQAQLSLLHDSQLPCFNNADYTHPYYWSPFVLIGNWL